MSYVWYKAYCGLSFLRYLGALVLLSEKCFKETTKKQVLLRIFGNDRRQLFIKFMRYSIHIDDGQFFFHDTCLFYLCVCILLSYGFNFCLNVWYLCFFSYARANECNANWLFKVCTFTNLIFDVSVVYFSERARE